MKRFLSIFLLVSLIASNFTSSFIYVGFEANRTYIAKTLCENRNRPELHCNGKCFLKKKLKEAEEKEKKQERENQKNRFQEILPDAIILTETKKVRDKISYPESLISATIDRSFSIFQPPRFC
ncbi:hypothetical protein [Pedobacter sp. ASV12]|uniref:hypothetical protein n=1 Tax=Pedobacter sp. ASV12 TaxID=2795120 RepID=UPI0018ED8E47|nr:hypothetical protein [Pedobacter sp. ASV12]